MFRVNFRTPIFGLLVVRVLFAQIGDPAAEAQRAQELVKAGKPEQAVPLYLKLAKAYPNNARLLLNLAIAEYNARRFADAATHSSAALHIDPSLMAANLFLGASLVERGENAAAVEPLEKVISAEPGERNGRLMLAQALLGCERYEEALKNFQISSELLPQSAKAWYGLGQVYDALSRQAAAKLEKDMPQSAFSLIASGDTELEQGRLGSAFRNYRQALALPGGDVSQAYAGLARIYRLSGHDQWAATQDALATHAEARPRSTGEPALLFDRYLFYRRQAHQAYEKLDQLPSLEQHLHAARMLENKGNWMEATAEWREALKLAPGDARVQTALTWALLRSRDYPPAQALAGDLLKAEPHSAEVNFLYGATLLNLQRPAEAIPYLRSATTNSRFLPAEAALGQALLQTGQARKAIPHLEAGLATDEDGDTHFQLVRAYQITGQHGLAEQALAAYNKFRSSVEARKSADEGSEIIAP
jgi:tetratricopeptide (TPR) repeat protein